MTDGQNSNCRDEVYTVTSGSTNANVLSSIHIKQANFTAKMHKTTITCCSILHHLV